MRYIITILIFTAFVSCSNQVCEINKDHIYKRDTSEQIAVELPAKNSFRSYEDLQKWFHQIIGLKEIDPSISGNEMRITKGWANGVGYIIVLKDTCSFKYCYIINYNDSEDPIKKNHIVSFNRINLGYPKIGWVNFNNSVKNLNVNSITGINKKSFDTERLVVTIENFEKGKYNKLMYSDPYKNKDVSPTHQKLYKLLKLFDDQFSLMNNY
jgi:hypothetical protein